MILNFYSSSIRFFCQPTCSQILGKAFLYLSQAFVVKKEKRKKTFSSRGIVASRQQSHFLTRRVNHSFPHHTQKYDVDHLSAACNKTICVVDYTENSPYAHRCTAIKTTSQRHNFNAAFTCNSENWSFRAFELQI